MRSKIVSSLRWAARVAGRTSLPLLGAVCLSGGVAHAQTAPPVTTSPVFNEDFSTSTLNRMNWNPTDRYQGIQRTRWSNNPTFHKDSDGTTYATLNLDSYNPISGQTGVTFWGTQLTSLSRFNVGSGIEYEARIRSKNMPPGIVEAFFAYGDTGVYKDTYQKSETDYEFITNKGGGNIWLNVWDDWNPLRGGPNSATLTPSPANWNTGNWNVFKIRWYPNRSEWIINDKIVRTESGIVPGSPMGVWLNIWAADSGWADAYSSTLQPASTPANNKRYSFDVDYVRVRKIPATASQGVVGTGTGLAGYYYDNLDFQNFRLARLDPRINFDWGNYAPDPVLGYDSFSARWIGKILPQFTQTYTFTARSGDGARVWINNKLIIDNWADHYTPVEASGKIALTAGKAVSIRVDYYDHTEAASMQLFWSCASTPKQLVPQSQLYVLSQPAAPTFAPGPRTYSTPQNVAITSTTANSVIRYTIDGTPPSASSPVLAAGATVRIGMNTVLRARAFVDGSIPSNTRTGQYLFTYTDTTGPSLAFKSPVANASVQSLSSVTGTVADAQSGLSHIDLVIKRLSDGFRWTGTTWINQEYGVAATISGNTWSVTSGLPSGTNLKPGSYELKAVGYDLAGNVTNKAENITVTTAAAVSAAPAGDASSAASAPSDAPVATDDTPSKSPSAGSF